MQGAVGGENQWWVSEECQQNDHRQVVSSSLCLNSLSEDNELEMKILPFSTL